MKLYCSRVRKASIYGAFFTFLACALHWGILGGECLSQGLEVGTVSERQEGSILS